VALMMVNFGMEEEINVSSSMPNFTPSVQRVARCGAKNLKIGL